MLSCRLFNFDGSQVRLGGESGRTLELKGAGVSQQHHRALQLSFRFHARR